MKGALELGWYFKILVSCQLKLVCHLPYLPHVPPSIKHKSQSPTLGSSSYNPEQPDSPENYRSDLSDLVGHTFQVKRTLNEPVASAY